MSNVDTKVILHLCADIGSDSRYYQEDENYTVIRVGADIGVENFDPPENVHGVIANPVCTEFSTASGFHKKLIHYDLDMVKNCQRIIYKCDPKWWVIENPANGRLKDFIGKPAHVYQPWEYGSPWTKKTALWGNFVMPDKLYDDWSDVPKIKELYVRPGRGKPSLAFLHKSAIEYIPEFEWAKDRIHTDADFRSLCSQGFAKLFYQENP